MSHLCCLSGAGWTPRTLEKRLYPADAASTGMKMLEETAASAHICIGFTRDDITRATHLGRPVGLATRHSGSGAGSMLCSFGNQLKFCKFVSRPPVIPR